MTNDDYCSRSDTAVCWCTNDPDEASVVGGTVAIIDRGRLLAQGSPTALSERVSPPTVEVRFDGQAPWDPAPGSRSPARWYG